MPNVQQQYVGVRVPKRGFSGAKKGVPFGIGVGANGSSLVGHKRR